MIFTEKMIDFGGYYKNTWYRLFSDELVATNYLLSPVMAKLSYVVIGRFD